MDQEQDRWIALYVLCAGVLMIVLDTTVVNVALPQIQDDLGFSSSSLAWVVNAYMIAFAGLLLLSGRLGDLVGRRTVLLGGLGLFTAASIACGAAQSQEVLIAARFVQGVGGALASAVTLGMIVTLFPEPGPQAKAMGVFGFVASAGGAVGLVAGGIITDLVSWHWIFLINVPIGIATAVMARRFVPADRGVGLRNGADVPGAVLVTGALMLAVYTCVGPAAQRGWSSSRAVTLGLVSAALLALFLARQGTAATPLMPLRLFKGRNTVGANLIQVFTVAGMFGMFFMGTLYVQRVLDYSPLTIGFAFLPMSVLMAVLSLRYSDKIALRFRPRNAVIGGMAAVAAGLLLFTQAPVGGSYVIHVLPSMVLMGLGCGASFPALMGLAMSEASREDAGLASGLVSTTSQAGGALGLAVLATLSNSRTAHQLAAGVNEKAALVAGYHVAFWVASGLVVAGVVTAVTLLTAPTPAPADDGVVPEREPVLR